MNVAIPVAALLGIASTLHCWGMCGGILAAFTFGIPGGGAHGARKGFLITCFNLGRVFSYTLGGAVAGALGHALVSLPWRTSLYVALQVVAGMIIVSAGLRLGGWVRPGGWLENAGARVWSRLQPLCRRLLPVDSVARALALGALWGWIPCGLVYSALAWSAASASAVDGAWTMLAFGAGTLPGMIGAGLAGTGLSARFSGTFLRRGLATLLLLAGITGPAASWYFAAHADHGEPGGQQHGHQAH